MTNLFFIRHGEYIYERGKDEGPRLDLGLSHVGLEQSILLSERLSTSQEICADVFLSSSERRAHETAEIVKDSINCPLILDSDLEEWRSDDGSIETPEFMEIWNSLSDRKRPFHRFCPECETGIEFSTRVHSALNRILAEHSGSTIVLMTHGGVIQVSFQYFFGYGDASFRRAYPVADNTSITHWRQDSGTEKWMLMKSNDARHLLLK